MQTISVKKYSNTWLIGASGGIGEELLKIIAEYSINVCACDLRNNRSAKWPANVNFSKVDCSAERQIETFANESSLIYGPPDLLVITAGYVSSKILTESTDDEIDKIYLNNFKLVVLVMKAFFKKCSKNIDVQKNIIVVSSNAGLESRPNQPIYAAMKSAINSLIKSQAVIWGDKNIKINVIAPGTVAVRRNINSLMKKYKNFPLDQSRPLGKIAFPDDLNPVCRLLLDKDLLMTGQILLIDGGSSLL